MTLQSGLYADLGVGVVLAPGQHNSGSFLGVEAYKLSFSRGSSVGMAVGYLSGESC